ncbi:MAG: NAD-dependent epimerase/dehydratase family protein [Blastopirellula sp.]|nr:NAD-dependent epimerase/dehydratase family protein [Blastopirellula sp.]
MRVLLTGATGFLGNNLLRLLVAEGHEVQLTLRPGAGGRALAGLKFDPVPGDLTNVERLLAESSDFDVLIHAAAMIQIGWSRLVESRQVNVTATERLAEFCRLKKRRMIHVSTVDTLAHAPDGRPRTESDREPGKPPISYVQSKREAEQKMLEQIEQGLDGIIIHPGFMLGPWDWKPSSGAMLLAIAGGPTPLAPAGGCSAVDVRDVADGILKAVDRGRRGERYILGGENLSYLELWQKMARAVGKRNGPRAKLPNWLAGMAGRVGDLAGKWMRQEPQVNSGATAMGQLQHFYSSEKAISQLGYRIGSLDDAIDDEWQFLVEYGYVRKS